MARNGKEFASLGMPTIVDEHASLCIRPPFPTPSSLDYQFLSFPFLPFLARYKTVRTDKFVGLFVEINRISNITTSNTRDKYKYKS